MARVREPLNKENGTAAPQTCDHQLVAIRPGLAKSWPACDARLVLVESLGSDTARSAAEARADHERAGGRPEVLTR